jgi:hypothetical protein
MAETGNMRIMTGTLDLGCKGFVKGPSSEIHVKTRMSWMPEISGTEKLEGYGVWPDDWR